MGGVSTLVKRTCYVCSSLLCSDLCRLYHACSGILALRMYVFFLCKVIWTHCSLCLLESFASINLQCQISNAAGWIWNLLWVCALRGGKCKGWTLLFFLAVCLELVQWQSSCFTKVEIKLPGKQSELSSGGFAFTAAHCFAFMWQMFRPPIVCGTEH